MSIAEVRKDVWRALWALRQGATPDRIARTDAESALDKLLRRIDDDAQFERDVVEPQREVDGDIILA